MSAGQRAHIGQEGCLSQGPRARGAPGLDARRAGRPAPARPRARVARRARDERALGFMRLLERESVLAELAGMRDLAATGRGTLVLVGGDAGIGKTALARRFCDQFAPGRVLIGRCDPVGTPRPLGPLAEIAPQAGGALAELARGRAGQDQMFAAALEVLQDPSRTTLVVIEDVQWADESTLDLLVFLGRRIESACG